MRVSIHIKLLTNAYFGSIRPIEGGKFSESLSMPSLYTVSGALATRLFEQGIEPNKFIEDIRKERLNIYGIYIYNGGYYIPITAQVIDNDNKLNIHKLRQVNKHNYASTSSLHKEVMVPVMGYRPKKHEDSYFIDLCNWSVTGYKDMSRETRTRTALNYSTKIPEEGKLFSLSMIHKPKVEYCIDIEFPDEYTSRLGQGGWLGHLGGESGLAEFKVNGKTWLKDLIDESNKSNSSDRYLAISHIPLKLINGDVSTPLGKIKYIVGRVGMLGGWDIRKGKMKKLYACIEPGSIFSVEKGKDKMDISDAEWYLNLLRVVIPTQIIEQRSGA